MALEQKLNLRLSQRLVMTPSLQQAIKLLQMSKLELEEVLTQEMVENPVLEIQGIARRLASTGIGVLVTDHNVRETLSIVDRAYIINAGEILRAGTPLALSSDAVVKKIYLGEAFQLN